MKRFVLLLAILYLAACKSPPTPQRQPEEPSFSLVFDHVEALPDTQIGLHFRLRAENPHSLPLNIAIRDWGAVLDGIPVETVSAGLFSEGKNIEMLRFTIPPNAVIETPVSLNMRIDSLSDKSGIINDDEYLAGLTINVEYQFSGGETAAAEASTRAAFPRVREPVFSVTSISILQADLINTRFKVGLHIDNPNIFPLNLSAMDYSLYGNGQLWAGGREQSTLKIPARNSAETELTLVMNFINMRRQLLDEIIALRQVDYRFNGTVDVETGIVWLPQFRLAFNLEGKSDVKK